MELETYRELTITVDFEVDPGQKLIMYPNDRAQEGIPASIEINSIMYRGVEVLVSEEETESIRQECWDYLEGLEDDAAEMMYDHSQPNPDW